MTLIKICSEKGRFSQSGGSFFKIFPGTLDPTMVGPPTSLNIWHLHFFKRADGPDIISLTRRITKVLERISRKHLQTKTC